MPPIDLHDDTTADVGRAATPAEPPPVDTVAPARRGFAVRTGALPLKRLFILAFSASLLVTAWVLVDVARFGGNPVSLVQPGAAGPSKAVFKHDFPQLQLPSGLGFDGQMFYALARQPMHLTKVAPALDRPRYRLQRPLLSWLVWAVHPSGGGVGLVHAFLLIGMLTLVLGGVSIGAISWSLGGRTWPAFVYPLLPGCYVGLRTSVADALGVSLALLAIALALRSKWGPAIFAGILAVLAKEVAILLLVGFALWRRDRRAFALVAAPLAVAAGWFLALHVMLPDGGGRVNEIVPPFVGLARSVQRWRHHIELSGMANDVITVAVAIFVLAKRGLRSPWGIAMVLQLGFITMMNVDVIANNLSGTRATLALASFTVLAVAVPAGAAESGPTADERVFPQKVAADR